MSLSVEDWVVAGFYQLCDRGHQSIKIDRLASRLSVSKGSFYWHFKNIAEFKQAMLTHWATNSTDMVFKDIAQSESDPVDQLRALVKFSTEDSSISQQGRHAEAAIRDWARSDDLAARLLGTVDKSRLQFVTGLFRQAGFSLASSRARANLLYSALIGLQPLAREGLVDMPGNLRLQLEILLRQ